MKNKIIFLIVLLIFFGLFIKEINACIPIFEFSKNLYLVKTKIDKKSLVVLNEGHYNDEIINGDWWTVYNGEIYSNKDFQGNPEVHKKFLEHEDETGIFAVINLNHIAISIKDTYECDGKDSRFCLNGVIDKIREIKNAGLISISDKDVENIEKIANPNSIITKTGFFQLGLLKIPPIGWVSYYDNRCIDVDDSEPTIVFLGNVVFVGNRIINYLVTLILAVVIIFIILLVKRNILRVVKK